MKLFDSGVSGNCYKVRLICAHLGLPLEREELSVVDRSNRPEVIGEFSPVQRVPVLVLDDGRSMFESNAIIDYLAEGTPYLPTDPYERQQVLAWQFFEQYEIEPNLAVARFLKLFEIEHTTERMAALHAAGNKGLQALERGLSGTDFIVGNRYSVADISLYAYTHVAHEGGFDLSSYAAIKAWTARVASQPGHILISD